VGSGGVSARACADCSEKSKLDIGSAEAIPCLCRRSNLRRPLYPPHPPPTLRGYFPLLRGMSIQDPPKGGFPVREGDDAYAASSSVASRLISSPPLPLERGGGERERPSIYPSCRRQVGELCSHFTVGEVATDGCLTNLPLYIYRGIQSII
jgi:hypothetical protein